MSEETKQDVRDICERIASGRVFQQAVEIAVDMHTTGMVSDAIEEQKKEARQT